MYNSLRGVVSSTLACHAGGPGFKPHENQFLIFVFVLFVFFEGPVKLFLFL